MTYLRMELGQVSVRPWALSLYCKDEREAKICRIYVPLVLWAMGLTNQWSAKVNFYPPEPNLSGYLTFQSFIMHLRICRTPSQVGLPLLPAKVKTEWRVSKNSLLRFVQPWKIQQNSTNAETQAFRPFTRLKPTFLFKESPFPSKILHRDCYCFIASIYKGFYIEAIVINTHQPGRPITFNTNAKGAKPVLTKYQTDFYHCILLLSPE